MDSGNRGQSGVVAVLLARMELRKEQGNVWERLTVETPVKDLPFRTRLVFQRNAQV